MPKKNAPRILLLSLFVLFLTTWSGAQSSQTLVTSSADAGSSSPAPTEQLEMRDELRALRAEVERLRSEVEQQKSTAPVSTRVEPAPTATGAGPNVPTVAAAN